MQRRNFLTAASLALGARPAMSMVTDGPRLNWRLAASTTKSLDVTWGGLQQMAQRVAAATAGRFQIQVFGAGELVPAFGVFDAVSSGTVPIGFAASFYNIGKDPTFAFDCAMPFGLDSRQQLAWMMQGGGLELMRELFADYKVYNIPCSHTGEQMGGWFRKEIHGVADLKGLKIRIAGLSGEVYLRLGATPQAIPTHDVYPALERGTIDAARLAAPHDDERAGLQRVARYYYLPNWEGNTQLSVYVNLDAWHALPPDYQTILEAACIRTTLDTQAAFDVANPAALRRMIEGGTQLRHFPRDMLNAAYQAANDMYQELADTNARFRKVYDHWRRFREREIAWFGVAERPFDNFMAASSGAALR